jgi:rRNA-processing protein FCF1
VVRRQLRLLDETLSKRRASVRKVLVYKPTQHGVLSLPRTDDAKVDEAIRELALRFDLSLILTGDRRWAQQLADKFAIELLDLAEQRGVSEEVLRDRWIASTPFIKKSTIAFIERVRLRLRNA